MSYRVIVLKDGTEFACNKYGEGVFSRRQAGRDWQQCTGTGQTPVFKTRQAFSKYVHKNYADKSGRPLARMTSSYGWPE